MKPEIVRLGVSGEAEPGRPDPERLVSGAPEQKIWNAYADPAERFFAGTWSSTRGAWRVRYTEHELCVMTAGRVRLTSESGLVQEFGPGDAFVVPGGFVGVWEVLEDCTKIYAICT